MSTDTAVAAVTDEDLFRNLSHPEECDVCMQPLPSDGGGQQVTYQSCCGKVLCNGCVYGIEASKVTVGTIALLPPYSSKCPFCRAATPTSALEYVERLQKRAKDMDPWAIYYLGLAYSEGNVDGLSQDYKKANKLWIRAGYLGCAMAYNNVAIAYRDGHGVERDMTKAERYYELAAIGGNAGARHELGSFEDNAGNVERAVRHWLISAGSGNDFSLAKIRDCFMSGTATKDDFENALRDHNAAKDEMRSSEREAAAESIRVRDSLLAKRPCRVPRKTAEKTLK